MGETKETMGGFLSVQKRCEKGGDARHSEEEDENRSRADRKQPTLLL